MQTDLSVENYGKMWFFVHKTNSSEDPDMTPSKMNAAALQAAKEARQARWEAKKAAALEARVRAPSKRQAAIIAMQRQVEQEEASNNNDEEESDEEDLEPLSLRRMRFKPAEGEDDNKDSDKDKGVMVGLCPLGPLSVPPLVDAEKLIGKDNGDENHCEAEHKTFVGSSNS